MAQLTVSLASALHRVDHGPYARMEFKEKDLDEIRYASLLHDFGKVGVREPVLVKAEKLFPGELELVRARFEIIAPPWRPRATSGASSCSAPQAPTDAPRSWRRRSSGWRPRSPRSISC